jgi:hypothetical protein
MFHAFDLNGRNRCTRQGGQQDATHRVPNRRAVPLCERFYGKNALIWALTGGKIDLRGKKK